MSVNIDYVSLFIGWWKLVNVGLLNFVYTLV